MKTPTSGKFSNFAKCLTLKTLSKCENFWKFKYSRKYSYFKTMLTPNLITRQIANCK